MLSGQIAKGGTPSFIIKESRALCNYDMPPGKKTATPLCEKWPCRLLESKR